MKLHHLIESIKDIWYHGSPKKFSKFDPSVERMNRGTNVSGIYLTQDEELARDYASRGDGIGYVYEVSHNAHIPFVEGKNKFTDDMMDEYVAQLVKHTNYKEDWARESLVPEALKYNKLKGDLSGDIKRAVYEAGNYDSYIFNDMGDTVLVVFDYNDVEILNTFQPQQLVKDPKYDDAIKQSKQPNVGSSQKEDPFDSFDKFMQKSL